MTIGETLLVIFVLIAVPATFIGVPIFVVMGGIQKFARKPLLRCFEGLDLHNSQLPGDVCVVYHTYRGFLVWFVQEEHFICAPPDDARLLLKRLLRFNLTWGLFSYGLLFVPLLSLGNYYAQKRSIETQQRSQNPRSSFKTVEGQCTGKRVGSVRGTGRRDVHNAQPVAGS